MNKAPGSLDQLFNQGATAYQQGDFPTCVSAFEAILAQHPDNGDVTNNLALAYHKCQRHDEAFALLDTWISQHPTHSKSYLNAGVIAEENQDLERAMQYYASGATACQTTTLYEHWAFRAHDLRDTDSLSQCLTQWPALQQSAVFINYHGLWLELQGKAEQAITHYSLSIEAKHGNQDTYHHLGSLLLTQGKLDEAQEAFAPILKDNPDHIQTCINLASIYKQRGELSHSAQLIQHVLQLSPDHREANDQWLSTLNYSPTIHWQEADSAHCQWGAKESRGARAAKETTSSPMPRPARKVLTIGLLSADFHQHPVAHFLLPWLRQDRERLHITLLCNGQVNDAVSDALREAADAWISIAGLDTAKAKQVIREANIDILIDLSGHTAGNRLDLLAQRCVPLQGTYLGYPNRTGLPTVDFHLGDEVVFPQVYDQRTTEIPVRLPLLAAYQPRPALPDVQSAPCLKNGYLTFGSLHNGIRLHDDQLRQWVRWIKDIPNAHLKIVRHTLKGKLAQRITQTLIDAGLPHERFSLCHEAIADGEHLAHYHDIDIALDSSPWSGHTTACEALWMGVPTVTLPGEHHCSRLVSSVLHAASQKNWIQHDEASLNAFLHHWHNNPKSLAQLRQSLRGTVSSAPLSDGAVLASAIEATLWQLWQTPDSPSWQALNDKGNHALAKGDIQEALTCFSTACDNAPEVHELKANLGNALLAASAHQDAIDAFQACLEGKPDYTPARQSLGSAYLSLGRYDEALACFKQLQSDDPSDWQGFYNEGNVWLAGHSPDKAIAAYQSAIDQNAPRAQVLNNLGEAHRMKREWEQALSCFTTLINDQPQHDAALTNRANCHLAMGHLNKAIEDFNHAAEAKHMPITPQGLMASCYDSTINDEALMALHQSWGKHIESCITPHTEFKNRIKPDRRLRIGWLSPDFRQHAVAQFLLPLIKALDPQQIQQFAYAHLINDDEVTDSFRQQVTQFKDITPLSDTAIAELIHRDRIDILIDTAGHTAHSRVSVMAARPAPVQLTYLGYPHPSGLTRVTTHLDCDLDHSKLTAPGFCFDPSAVSDPTPLPALNNGYITFGSLHTLARLTDDVLTVWLNVMNNLPKSRLLIARDSVTPWVQADLRQRWQRLGGNANQLILHQVTSEKLNHLDLYRDIDILLDTFPWTGHTTACEALSQGVPTLTLVGPSQRQSMVARVLNAVGLDDWIAHTPEEFINVGSAHAQGLEALAKIRHDIVKKLSKSRLCDAKNAATLFKHTLRAHWHQWCEDPK